MIKINRHLVDCPPSLNTNNKDLTENDYKKDDVIESLLKIQHSKCCYCEKKLKPLGDTARWVEHIVTRTDIGFKDANGDIIWNQANAWENLLYSCSTCNRNKGTTPTFDSTGNRILIDPSHSEIDPEDHIDFKINGLFIKYKDCSDLGKNTIENLKLDKRTDWYAGFRIAQREIDACFGELVIALFDDDAVMAESKLADLARLSSSHLSHASFRRKYIIQKTDRFNNNELQEINQHYGRNIQPIVVDIANGYQIIK